MNTHIIIPIEDIEKAQDHYLAYVRAKRLDKLITNAKQISLDEKDIEEKALKVYPQLENLELQSSANIEKQISKRIGYQEALKNLKE